MRVIAGVAAGRNLRVPPGGRVRPTADRVKEALFSSLEPVAGLAVLDLFAGTGALAIEALSRGAATAVLVERDARLRRLIRANCHTAGVGDAARLVTAAAARFCAGPHDLAFDLVLADPPYDTARDDALELFGRLAGSGALRPGARLVLERDRHAPAGGRAPPGLAHERTRPYGDTVLEYYRYDAAARSAVPGAGPDGTAT